MYAYLTIEINVNWNLWNSSNIGMSPTLFATFVFTISYIVPLLRILCQIKAKFIEHIAFCLSFSQLQKPILAQKE